MGVAMENLNDLLVLSFAKGYVSFLNRDNGVVSKSHLYMHEQLKCLTDAQQQEYHEAVAAMLKSTEKV